MRFVFDDSSSPSAPLSLTHACSSQQHPAEVEAEALNKELSKDAGISAGVHFIWERGREVCICVQLRRRIEGLTSGTVTALGLDPAKAVKVRRDSKCNLQDIWVCIFQYSWSGPTCHDDESSFVYPTR